MVLLSEVGLGVDALRETKVGYFDQKVRVDPGMKDKKYSLNQVLMRTKERPIAHNGTV